MRTLLTQAVGCEQARSLDPLRREGHSNSAVKNLDFLRMTPCRPGVIRHSRITDSSRITVIRCRATLHLVHIAVTMPSACIGPVCRRRGVDSLHVACGGVYRVGDARHSADVAT